MEPREARKASRHLRRAQNLLGFGTGLQDMPSSIQNSTWKGIIHLLTGDRLKEIFSSRDNNAKQAARDYITNLH